MSSNDQTNTSGREQTAYQMNISTSNASTLESTGNISRERRGQATGPDSFRMYTDKEQDQMKASGQASRENRGQHVTGQVTDQYTVKKDK
jgi:hypothetical protein